jgi:hypothetical protein
MGNTSLNSAVEFLDKTVQSLRSQKQALTIFSNSKGYLLSSQGCRQFCNAKEAVVMLTNPLLEDSKPKTAKQEVLKRKHGTPREFADAIIRGLGEYSVDEARAAIDKYNVEWLTAASE